MKHVHSSVMIALVVTSLLAACAAEPTAVPATLAPSPSPTTILTPAAESALSTAEGLVSSSTRTPTLTTPAAVSLPDPTLAPTGPPQPITPSPATHTVQPGDTLLGLAQQYGVPMAAIQLHNGMGESTLLHAGEQLSIPPQSAWEGTSLFWVVHAVKPGETLVGIADTYGLEVEQLQATNELADAGQIQVGQELILPLDALAIPFTSTPAPTTPPLLSATPNPTPESPAGPPSPALPPADIAAWPHEMVRIINEVRAQHGLEPLAYNETLAQAAQAHADDCFQRGWCSHTGSDGSDVKTRILRAGYIPTGWAECWAWNQSPQAAVDMWMDEVPPDDPHRSTLLSTWLTEIGVGVVQAPSWGYYFIADFGRP